MQRARSGEAKEERREAILATALRMYERDPRFAAFTMAALAKEAGLAKGTLYLYFRTKEELFLALLERLFGEWFDDVDGRLARGKTWSGDTVAALLAASAAERPTLVWLLAIQGSILEENVDADAALAFKTRVMGRTGETGAAIEARLAWLAEGGGARLLVRLHALVVGLWQMAEPAAVIRGVLDDPALAAARVDFARELGHVLRLLLVGMEDEAAAAMETNTTQPGGA